MFTCVAWATDGSEHSDRALPYAVRLAVESGAPLHAIHVAEHLLTGRAAGQYVRADEQEREAKIERQLATAGESVTVAMHRASNLEGPVAKVIGRIAEEAGADVLVVGSRGHGALAGAALGSVTQHLLHDAHCPVLSIGPSVTAAAVATEDSGEPAVTPSA
ncbi:MAG TPA: universal stress protein [Solirubrobacteraceae bacterium]|nr:universal stress protein [Solirubrobacteraceae bacterium]